MTTRKITRKVAIIFKTNSNLVVDLSQHQTNNFRLGTDLKEKEITINIVRISPQEASQLQGLLEKKKSLAITLTDQTTQTTKLVCIFRLKIMTTEIRVLSN
jgi:hypothetical protein